MNTIKTIFQILGIIVLATAIFLFWEDIGKIAIFSIAVFLLLVIWKKSSPKEAEDSDDWKFIKTKVFINLGFSVAIVIIILFTFFLKIIPLHSGIIFIFFLSAMIWVLFIGIQDSREHRRAGLYLGPFQIQVLRAAVSLGIGQLVAGAWALIDSAGNKTTLPEEWFVYISLAIAIPFFWSFSKKIVVDVNHVGVATFFGRRLDWLFIVEGEYTWYGTLIAFGISQEPIVNPETDKNKVYTTAGEKKGYPYMGVRTLSIWHDLKMKSSKISVKSKTNTDVTVRLDLSIATFDPMLWMLYADAILQIANRARAAILEAVGNFIDVDANPCKSAIADLLWGKTVLFIFTVRDSELRVKGSVVYDNADKPLYVVLGKDDKGLEIPNETEESARARLKEKSKNANGDLLKAATINDGGDINIYPVRLEEPLSKIVESTGSKVTAIVVSGIDVSERVKEATEKLSAEANERAAEEKTAHSIDNVRKILAVPGVDPNIAILTAAKIAGVSDVSSTAVYTGSGNGKESDIGDKIITAAVMNNKNKSN